MNKFMMSSEIPENYTKCDNITHSIGLKANQLTQAYRGK